MLPRDADDIEFLTSVQEHSISNICEIYMSNNELVLRSPAKMKEVSIYSIDGKCLKTVKQSGIILRIPTNNYQGILLTKVLFTI